MDKHSIKLMRRKKKLFPWLRTFCGKYSEKFFNAENTEVFEYLFLNVEKEMKDICLELNKEKSEDLFNILNSYFLHFWWQIRWKSCKKWKTYWKKVESTEVSANDSQRICCVRLLYYMILLSIFLTGGDEKSDWIGRILTAIKSLPDAVDILCSALLLTGDLKKKHKPIYCIILKHTLCCETVKNTTEPQTYCKVILLFRRLLKLTKDKKEKAQIFLFTSKLKVPWDIQNWLSSQNIEDSKDLNYDDNLTQELLSRSYPDELLRKLSEILTEYSFCKRKSVKVDSVDAHNVPSVTLKGNTSEEFNNELGEDLMESLVETNIQNGSNGMGTTISCIAAENNSDDINDLIKDLFNEVSNPIEGMPGKTHVNHCLESLKKVSKKQKLENEVSEKKSHKKKKDKISKQSSKDRKKNKKKSKEKSGKSAVKINGEFEAYSKLSVPASDIVEKDLLESLVNTSIQNGLNGIKTTSCIATESTSGDINNRIKDTDLENNEVFNPMEGMSGKTNVKHCSKSLKKSSKKQKLENVESERPNHKKKKKDKILKESSKNHKKSKKKSKEKRDKTAVKINEEFETYSKLSVPTLEVDVPPNITSKENISENLNGESGGDFLESLVKTNIQNGLGDIMTTTSSKATENTYNDINDVIKDKDLNSVVSNPMEGVCGETNVTHCSGSLEKASKKRKLENEENERHNPKKKKDKILKRSSKNHKKNKKKSKEKPDKTAVKLNKDFQTYSKISELASNNTVQSNVTSKEDVWEILKSELGEDLLESLVETGIQNSLNGIKTTTSCVVTKNTSNDANNMIKDDDSHNNKKKRKDKILKESSKNHKKNKKKSIKKADKNKEKSAVEISENFQTLNEISHEQQDYNLEAEQQVSKSESRKKEQNNFKESKKQSQEKKVTKHKKITDIDNPDSILSAENFSNSEKLSFHTKNNQYDNCINESDNKKKKKDKLKKMSKEKNSSDSISEGNYSGPCLRKENAVDDPKKSPKVRKKKLFNNDLYCVTNSQKEIQPSRTIANNCIVPENSKVGSNFSSYGETTAFSDISISELLKIQKVDLYRNNAALGIENKHTSKTNNKKQRNSNGSETKRELSVCNNDLLLASKEILKQAYVPEASKSPSLFDNDSGAEETENGDNQSTETLSFHSANVKDSVVDSDFVNRSYVSSKSKSTSVLISKHSNNVQSTAVFQQSEFTNNTEDTFLSMDYLSEQDLEARLNIQTSSSECSFSSISHSSLNPSIVLKDVFQCKSAQKYISASEKSFTSISESDSKAQCTTPPTATDLEMNVSHELTLENIAKANELYRNNEGTLTDCFCSDKKCKLPSAQNVYTLPIADNLNNRTEFQSPSLIQATNSNILCNKYESELIDNSVSQSLFNASVMNSQTNECGTQYLSTETVNYKSVGTATEIINSTDLVVNCNNADNSNRVSSVQVIINFPDNEDCSVSKKQQFVANFDFQTVNSVRTPIISYVYPVNSSSSLVDNIHNPNLDSTENYHPLHIIPFNQATDSIEKGVNFNKYSNTNIFYKPEKNGQCVALNDSGLSQTLCTASSPTIANESNTITHSQLFLNSSTLNNGTEAVSNSSFCKNETPLSENVDLKRLTTENLDSLNRELNKLPFETKIINNDSSYRTSTIYSDASEDDNSTISTVSNFSNFQTELSVGETLEIGASSKPSSCRRNNFQVDSEPESSLILKSEPTKIENIKSEKCSKGDSGLSKSTSSKEKTPKENTSPVKYRYNLRARKSLQTPKTFNDYIDVK